MITSRKSIFEFIPQSVQLVYNRRKYLMHNIISTEECKYKYIILMGKNVDKAWRITESQCSSYTKIASRAGESVFEYIIGHSKPFVTCEHN